MSTPSQIVRDVCRSYWMIEWYQGVTGAPENSEDNGLYLFLFTVEERSTRQKNGIRNGIHNIFSFRSSRKNRNVRTNAEKGKAHFIKSTPVNATIVASL